MQSMTLARRTRRLVTLAAVTASFAVVPAVAPHAPLVDQAAAAACKKASVGGKTKCLARGQFCAIANKSDYRRAGFTCASDGKGRNRLR